MIKIFVLGQFHLQGGDNAIELSSRPAQSLLAYLVLNAGVTHRREKLASLLWPEATENNARNYLRQALWRIRKSLEGGSIAWGDYLQISDIDIGFNDQSDYWLDADFLLEPVQDYSAAEDLIEIVRLYKGELLPGFYDEWVVLERERLHSAYHQKMNLLLDRLVQVGQWELALEWSEHWIQLGYSPEPAFRALMIAYAGLGDQSMVGATYQRCVQALDRELGLGPSTETQRLYEQLISGESLPHILGLPERDSVEIREEPPTPGLPPYKGLEPFDVGDADFFYGRKKLTARLVERLQDGEQLLFVVGASGSGKSSLVRAGLIPALAHTKQFLDGSYPSRNSDDWLVHVIRPTTQPLEALATSLCQNEPSLLSVVTLIDDLRQDPCSLYLYARRLCQKNPSSRLLLVVDQFEEVFTLCREEVQRSAFIDNLLATVDQDGPCPVILVITLRADFYAYCSQYPGLRQQLTKHQEYIGPMSTDELRQAIEEPARRGVWEFEDGLVDLILRDIKGEPGSLPLLSHALLETWQRRRGSRMTLKGYAEAGGVRGAIARTAEAVYQQLSSPQQQLARQIFLRLTELGEDTPETRRRVHISELLSSPDQQVEVEEVLENLIEARLVTRHEQDVEVAHEALIREWPSLRQWLQEDRQGIRLHHELTEAALAWDAMDRDESILYRGARLVHMLEWEQRYTGELNILEREFILASNALAERRQQERESQRQRELQTARQLAETEQQRAQEGARANRQLRWLVAGLAGILLVAILSAVFAFNQRTLAQNEAHLASSRELAAAALNNLEVDPELAILLALEAVEEARTAGLQVPREAEEALHQSLQASRLDMVLYAHQDGARSLDYSPDGKRLASVGKDRTMKLWDITSGELLDSVQASIAEISSVAFSPDGEVLATTDFDLTAKIWDSYTLDEITILEGHQRGLTSLAFSPDGDQLITSAMYANELFIWDISTRQVVAELVEPGDSIAGITISPDGHWIVTGGLEGELILWDAITFQEMARFEGDKSWTSLAFSPDSSLLASGSIAGTVTIWDVASGENLLTIYAHADVIGDIAFSPDGSRLATASQDRKAKVWEASTGRELLELSGHTGGILSIAFSPSGDHLATASEDGTVRFWNVTLSQEWMSFPTHGGAGRIAFSPDSAKLAAGRGDRGEVHIWDLSTGGEAVKLSGGGHPGGVEAVTFSPDGDRLVSTGVDRSLKIWDVDSGGQLLASRFDFHIHDVAYSPDGSLLAVGGESFLIKLLHADTTEELAEFTNYTETDGIAFSPDGEILVSTSRVGSANSWDVSTSTMLQNLSAHTDSLADIAFSPDGGSLALASRDETVSIWEKGADEPRLILRGHAASVMGVAYNSDGTRIATASLDGTVRLWDAATGEELLQLVTDGGAGLLDVAISPDGKMLATSADDAVRIYLLDVQDLIALAQSRLSRGFTRQECIRFLPEERCDGLVYPTPTPQTVGKSGAAGRICQLTENTGIYKGGYDYPAYLGVIEAAERHGWDKLIFIPEFFASSRPLEFERIMNSDCDLVVVASGFYLREMVYDNALKYPEQRFLLMDNSFDPPLENVWTVTYAVDQSAFLAGYLAAAITRTGVIGTFGGAKVPAVIDFMAGFEAGMHHYNQRYGADVKLLGWDTARDEGYILGTFFDDDLGFQYARRLLDQGADIIFPVAGSGPGGGALQAVVENGDAYLIGVDQDFTDIFPWYAEAVLTSVEKRLDTSVIQVAEALANGDFEGGAHLGGLENGGVALTPFYDLEKIIPDYIKTDLEQIKSDIIAGKIQTKPKE